MTDPKTARIRELNDALRSNWAIGHVSMTSGIRALPEKLQSRIAEQVELFDTFTPDNDPHGEHDFGALTIEGHKVFWKIDYYAPSLQTASEDPADAKKTFRVLTIMLAEEY